MPFESEILELDPLQLNKKGLSHGLTSQDGKVIQVDDDIVQALQAIAEMQRRNESGFTLQQMILQLRQQVPPTRLSIMKKTIQFLCEHGMLHNPSAQRWLALLKRDSQPTSALKRLGQLLKPKTATSVFPRESWEHLPIIRQLEPELRQQILAAARVENFPQGFRICRQGARDRMLMVLLSGEAAVVRRSRGEPGKMVAVLQPKAMFGEISHFLNEPRSADVLAMSDCEVLCIPPPEEGGDNYPETDLKRFKLVQMRLWFLQALQRNPLFQDIPSEAFDALLLHGEAITFEPGVKIIGEGDPGDSCYFVVQGTVQVTQNGRAINRLTSGSVIGEIGLFFGSSGRTATVTADSKVIVVRYSADEFWSMLSNHLILGVALESLAEKRLARDQARHA